LNNLFKTDLQKYPAVFAAVPFIIGILINYLIRNSVPSVNFYFTVPLLAVSALLILVMYTRLKGKLNKLYILFFSLILVFAFFRFQLSYFEFEENNIAGKISILNDKEILLYGKVIEPPEIKDNRARFVIESDSIKYGSEAITVGGNIQVTVYRNKYRESVPKQITYGDKIELNGKLEALPHRRNPGEFDYGEYLRLHGIDASFTSFGFENIKSLSRTDADIYKSKIIYPVKEYSIKVINNLVGGEEGEFLKGLVLGERSNISKQTKEDFVNAGVSHIIAVSGLNVAYVLIIIGALLLPLPLKQTYKIFIMIAFLIFYMNLTGNVPSIVRATIMASVFLLSQVFERKTISYNIIAFSALVILVIDPRQLFDAGFILSYSAILSILYFYPKLNKLASSAGVYKKLAGENFFHRSARALLMLVLGTLAAQMGTLPVTALMFRKISVVSLFTNIAAIPLSNIALAIGFIMIITSTFSIWLAGVFAVSATFLLHWLLNFIDFSARLDFSYIETYWADWLLLIFYYAFIFTMFTVRRENLKPRLIAACLLTANFILFRSILDENYNLTLSFLDVGNSNSCLITSPRGNNVLINPGTSTVKYTSAERNVIPYLKIRGVKELDLLLITSLNKDEFRNLIYFVQNFPVKKLTVPVFYKPLFEDTLFYKYFVGENIEYIDYPKIISIISGLRLYIVYDYKTLPSNSMLVHLLYGKELFTFDDIKEINEEYLYTSFSLTDTTRILKVPASGSFNFIMPEAIVRLNPETVIISSSRSRKRLNSDIFSESLRGIGVNVFETRESGAVIFESDGIKTKKVDW
jgi:competence protein ComEC